MLCISRLLFYFFLFLSVFLSIEIWRAPFSRSHKSIKYQSQGGCHVEMVKGNWKGVCWKVVRFEAAFEEKDWWESAVPRARKKMRGRPSEQY